MHKRYTTSSKGAFAIELKYFYPGLPDIPAPRYALTRGELRYIKNGCREEAIRFLRDIGLAAVYLHGEDIPDIHSLIAEMHTPPIDLSNGDRIRNVAFHLNEGIKAAALIQDPDTALRESRLAKLDEWGLTAHRCTPDTVVSTILPTTPETKSA